MTLSVKEAVEKELKMAAPWKYANGRAQQLLATPSLAPSCEFG